ncbi:MAG: four helix bundle suffix domain-containing protein [Candidatus Roizmanbacteria bacterium]|nr:four helix bundle suffix domain-containing protein [Candidatus Roizmanbacteria bacterium]
MSNLTHKKGGYQSLIVYWLAIEIYDLTAIFCQYYIDKKSRTYDQMVQAARSGKQNIVEGSLEPSVESNIKLTGVARASYGELLEDFKDFLRQRKLPIWIKDDPRVLKIRQMRISTYKSNKSNESNLTYGSYLTNGESFANLMITLCFKEGYLLDRLVQAQQDKFVKEGGFREKLFKKRIDYKNRQF